MSPYNPAFLFSFSLPFHCEMVFSSFSFLFKRNIIAYTLELIKDEEHAVTYSHGDPDQRFFLCWVLELQCEKAMKLGERTAEGETLQWTLYWPGPIYRPAPRQPPGCIERGGAGADKAEPAVNAGTTPGKVFPANGRKDG